MRNPRMQLEKACLQQQRPSTTTTKKKTNLKIYRTFVHSFENLYLYVQIKRANDRPPKLMTHMMVHEDGLMGSLK